MDGVQRLDFFRVGGGDFSDPFLLPPPDGFFLVAAAVFLVAAVFLLAFAIAFAFAFGFAFAFAFVFAFGFGFAFFAGRVNSKYRLSSISRTCAALSSRTLVRPPSRP
jgi:hypothetical protein